MPLLGGVRGVMADIPSSAESALITDSVEIARR